MQRRIMSRYLELPRHLQLQGPEHDRWVAEQATRVREEGDRNIDDNRDRTSSDSTFETANSDLG